MKKLFFAVSAAIFLLASCTTSFKKTKSGLEYKVIKNKDGKKVNPGNFMELQVVETYNDSILTDTRKIGMPSYAMYDTAQFPPDYKQIFADLNVGDSVVVRISTDSIKKQTTLPPFMKEGKYVLSTYKVTNVFLTQAEADKARTVNMTKAEDIRQQLAKEQLIKDEKTIKDYLAKNNIQAVRAPNGTYVQIIQPGTGEQIDTSMLVEVNYTGKTLAGNMFDSNTDPAKGHVEPFTVNLTSDQNLGGIIEGWKDGLPLAKVGSKLKLFIPSTLAYGTQGSGPDIKPNEILVFDIDVLKRVTRDVAMKKMQDMQMKMMEMQRKYSDSVKQSGGGQEMPN